MNYELEQKLMNDFVFMEERNVFSDEKLGEPKGCECGDGWFDVIHNLCKELNELYLSKNKNPDDIFVLQVKEKYGGLRFYTNGLIEGGYEIISKYENLSETTCEICGEIGKIRGDYWLKCLCDKHERSD